MDQNIVRVGDNFINFSTLLWVEVQTISGTNRRTAHLVYGSREGGQNFALQLNPQDSEKIIQYLEANSRDFRS